jgi:hypothetical protein
MKKYDINDFKIQSTILEMYGADLAKTLTFSTIWLRWSVNRTDPIPKFQATYIKKFFHADQPKSKSERASELKQ